MVHIALTKNQTTESSQYLIATKPIPYSINNTIVEKNVSQSPTLSESGSMREIHKVVKPKRVWYIPSFLHSQLKVPEKPVPLSPRSSASSAPANEDYSASPKAIFTDIISFMQSKHVSIDFL